MADSLEERVARLEAKVDLLIKEVEDLRTELRTKNSLVKYVIYLYVSTIGFLAALFGVGWHPP